MTPNSTELARELPFAWRISRYDPTRRDARGAFVGNTWTSIADVGKIYDGAQLTLAEYERVEQAYVETFVAFAHESRTPELEVRAVDAGSSSIREGTSVSVDDAKTVVRAMLREEAICRLEAPTNDFYLHVGFDLYMYIGSTYACRNAVARAGGLGLYVDSGWPSPMLSTRQ
jgi:hypothetical protein